MKNYTESFEESQEELNERVDAMLNTMVVETALYSIENKEPPPRFTRQQIADFCGCSKDHIRRIEKEALRQIKVVAGKK